MNRTSETLTSDSDGSFDPREAASVLIQTNLRARRAFEPSPPWLLVLRAFLALSAYGAIWLSVRGQHPYAHPTAAVIPVGIGVGIISTAASAGVARRAAVGIAGRPRMRPPEIWLLAAIWVGLFVAIWPLAASGASDSILDGLYPAAAPPIVCGLVWAAMMAGRADWRACGAGLAAVAVGVVALFTGPVGAWAVVGVGLCLVLLEHAAEIAWRQRT
jgi:hypothetical protein